jgi:hypothetical protein
LILRAGVLALVAWGLFELLHDDYKPPKEPTDPYDIEAKRFAHSIKLPDSVPTASYYPWWLGSEAYFDYLCKHEAGEWIFKKVENVEGVFQMRPREKATTEEFMDRFAMEDPYGYTTREAIDPGTLQIGVLPYVETTLAPGRALSKLWPYTVTQGDGPYWKYGERLLSDRAIGPIRVERSKERASQYGFTWRGIRRPHDRELGIAGGELIVLDLKTLEILSVRRGFAITGRAKAYPGGVYWEIAHACPQIRRPWDGKMVPKDDSLVNWHLRQVFHNSKSQNREEIQR